MKLGPDRAAPSQTVDKALAVLTFLGDQGTELGVTSIARSLRMNISTAYRLLRTLERRDFAYRNPLTAKYRLGLKLAELGDRVFESADLAALALPTMRALSELSLETIHLMVRSGDVGLYVARIESPQRVRVASSVGQRQHLHCSAVGKAILAFLPPDIAKDIIVRCGLPSMTSHTLTTPEALHRNLEAVRGLGFALDNMEGEDGVRCVGAPIFARDHHAIASISISGPAYRVTIDKLKGWGDRVRRAADEVSRRLGLAPAIGNNHEAARNVRRGRGRSR